MDKPASYVSAIHDIKETAKRTFQFGIVALIFAFITLVANLIHGNTLSALLVCGMAFCMAIILWFNKRGHGTITKVSIVFTLSVFIAVIAFAEGLKTGGYFYFIPVLFALPFLVNNSKKYNLELGLYLTVPITCFTIVLFFCEEKSSWQYIPDEVYQVMFYTNSLSILLLCAVFSYLSIFLERKYAKALMEQIIKAEDAVDARTKFLSSMGHELRTPLNGIIGATNLIRKVPSVPEQAQYIDILKHCSDHMLGLVNDILDFNKIEQDKLELHPVQCNLKHILHQSILPFKDRFEEKGLELRLLVDKELDVEVLVDDVRLVQVINNMLSNALKFTDTGYVKLEAGIISSSADTINVQFAIEDTGIGIKQELQHKIFDSFWQVYNESTRKYGGTGLGLTICHRLLQLMESKLHVQSHEGKGSRFYFVMSLRIQPTARVQPDKKSEQTSMAGFKVLVAEDNPINMLVARKILEDWQIEVTCCENGLLALEKVKAGNRYNLVLMDLEMPVMDGSTALRELRKVDPDLPVLAFTAALMDNVMFDSLISQGFADCILKPFQPQHLQAKLKKYGFSKAALEQ